MFNFNKLLKEIPDYSQKLNEKAIKFIRSTEESMAQLIRSTPNRSAWVINVQEFNLGDVQATFKEFYDALKTVPTQMQIEYVKPKEVDSVYIPGKIIFRVVRPEYNDV